MFAAVGTAAKAATNATVGGLQWVLRKTQALLNWLFQKFESGAFAFLAIAGVIAGVLWFAPEILEGVGEAYEAKYRRHYQKEKIEGGK